jgi:hypothetical protein
MNKKINKKVSKKTNKKVIKKAKKGEVSKALVVRTKAPSPLSQQQLLFILQRTPVNHIYRRKAKGEGEWEYVTGVYVKKVLNYCFGWMWDFSIKEHGREGNQIWVLGKLTIKNKNGKEMISKEQFGRADIKFYKDKSKGIVDYGNDLKAAATDALKKCASELGIASDVYGREEFKDIQKVDRGYIPPKDEITDAEIEEATGEPVLKPKLDELKGMLKGKTDSEKLVDLKKRTGIIMNTLDIDEKRAGVLIAMLLKEEVR